MLSVVGAVSWTYFNRAEFACGCCRRNEIDDDFVDRLDGLRAEFGKPIVISSGYRCPEHNERVSSTGPNGPHVTGHAADIPVSRGEAFRLAELAFKHGFTGIGFKQHGSSRFLHLDDLVAAEGRPRPTIWSYG